jgi:hypothetical protein
MTKRHLLVAMTFLAIFAALGVVQAGLQRAAAAQGATVQAPMFEVDPFWPKPLPNHWLLGSTIGVFVIRRTTSGSSIAAPRRSTPTSAGRNFPSPRASVVPARRQCSRSMRAAI